MKTFLFSQMDSAQDPGFSCVSGPWNKLTRRGLSCLFKGNVPSMPVSGHGYKGRSQEKTHLLRLEFFLAPAGGRIISTMSDLAAKTCVPCRGGVPPLKGEELSVLQKQVDAWNIIEEHHITKTFKFPDFRGALKFVNRVGELAEEQGHHPDILLAWGKVDITTWTHKINGLTESDFILAAKIDQLSKS
jgi:4a-hydroxytetrahydrobiopterin dehydratase